MVTEQFQSHIAYMLDEDEKYSLLAVKTLTETHEDSLLQARMISKNGRDRIIYSTENLRNYLAICNDMSDKHRKEVLCSLADAISIVSNSPFWELEYLDLRREQIYIDSATGKVKFAVVPRVFDDTGKAGIVWTERLLALVSEIVRSMEDYREMYDLIREIDTINRMTDLLERHRATNKLIEVLVGRFGNKSIPSSTGEVKNVVFEFASQNGRFSFIDNLEEFVIGSSEGCNGLLNISRAVSKRHCKIINKSGEIFITDLHSTNGTWLNGKRITPDEYVPVKDGDVARLADIQLRIRFEY